MIKDKKDSQEIEGAEYGVDSRYHSKNDRLEDGKTLMEARLQRMQNISPEQIMKARLMQLKLKMEGFLKHQEVKEEQGFTDFLAGYIDTIYSKRSNFARDIDITPVLLSKVLNGHRQPNEAFMLRLMIHSEKTYERICDFNKEIWYEVFYQERLSQMKANQDQWRPEVERHVTTSV